MSPQVLSLGDGGKWQIPGQMQRKTTVPPRHTQGRISPVVRAWQRELFGIDHAPPKIRAHGLREAHIWPLVSKGRISGDHSGSFRVHASGAWGFPEIELRTGNSFPCIILDLDGENALYRIVVAVDHGEIRIPNWAVTRKAGGGTHAVWNLARPVHRGERARPSPLRALARVSEYYAAALLADAGYTGVLSHNPMSAAHGPGFVTNWFRHDPYTLPELGEVIPFGWRKPTIAGTAIGRNCSMFDALRRWAGKPENRGNDVLAAAMSINEEIGRLHGKAAMDQSEVAAIARSVDRKRREWIAKDSYYSSEQRSLWGRERGIRSGKARRKRNEDRDRAIIQAVDKGRSLRDVGREFGLSLNGVQWIVKRCVR